MNTLTILCMIFGFLLGVYLGGKYDHYVAKQNYKRASEMYKREMEMRD